MRESARVFSPLFFLSGLLLFEGMGIVNDTFESRCYFMVSPFDNRGEMEFRASEFLLLLLEHRFSHFLLLIQIMKQIFLRLDEADWLILN